MRTPQIRFLGTPAAAGTGVWVNPQSELLREPNLLVPGKKPVGSVRQTTKGNMYLLREGAGTVSYTEQFH